jgi:hypothetical protein
MNVQNLVTTLRQHRIGTSFAKGVGYFVSTVYKEQCHGYETIIKEAGIASGPLCLLYAKSPKDAMINHIALSRAAISMDEVIRLNEAVVKDYFPTELIEMLDKDNASQEPNTFLSEYCHSLIQMSGLNYKQSRGGKMKIIIFIIGFGLLYWFFK